MIVYPFFSQWCSSREDLWDEKIVEDASAIQRAIELQKVLDQNFFRTIAWVLTVFISLLWKKRSIK